MAPMFVFAEDVAKAIREGKKEIIVSENARISSAALDLIKEKGVRVVRGSAGKDGSETESNTDGPAAQAMPAGEETPRPGESAATETQGKSFSEEEVEIIVNKVLSRFRELKGRESAQTVDAPSVAEDDDLVICRCEEITKGEIKEAIRNGMKTLNGIKRVTRAGMGLCQGQTCQRLVTQILASELGVSPGEVTPTTARAPVRPLKLTAFATG
jgi:bacterioferritin-associated ferredoxin